MYSFYCDLWVIFIVHLPICYSYLSYILYQDHIIPFLFPIIIMYVCIFLANVQHTVTKLWGGGVPTSGSGYAWPRLCASPRYIFNSPYIKYTCQWWYKTNEGQKMRTSIGHQCGQLSLRGRTTNLGSYVLKILFKPNEIQKTTTIDEWYKKTQRDKRRTIEGTS